MDRVSTSPTIPRGESSEGHVTREMSHRKDWRGWKFMGPFAIMFVLVFVIPIIYAIWLSFYQQRLVGGNSFVGLANYTRLSVMSNSGPLFVESAYSLSSRFPSCSVCQL